MYNPDTLILEEHCCDGIRCHV